MLVLHTLGHFLVLSFLLLSLRLSSSAQARSVVSLVPCSEGSSVDLHDGRLCKGVCSDEFVVGRVIGDDNDTGLAGDSFAAPREVTAVESETTVFCVATSNSDKMDSL